jgi:hypothetical protein
MAPQGRFSAACLARNPVPPRSEGTNPPRRGAHRHQFDESIATKGPYLNRQPHTQRPAGHQSRDRAIVLYWPSLPYHELVKS